MEPSVHNDSNGQQIVYSESFEERIFFLPYGYIFINDRKEGESPLNQ